MKKRTAIFFTAFITLVSFVAGCETTDRETATEPIVTPTPTPMTTPMTTPETYPSPATSPGAVGTTGLPVGATHRVTDITRNPNALIGKTVTVVADVDEVYGPRAFELDEDSDISGDNDDDLLVLIPKAGNLANVDDQWKRNKVRVTGVVQRMNVSNIEREIGWDLQPKLETEFKNEPVLIARSIERVNQ